jgi:hypothetical protein
VTYVVKYGWKVIITHGTNDGQPISIGHLYDHKGHYVMKGQTTYGDLHPDRRLRWWAIEAANKWAQANPHHAAFIELANGGYDKPKPTKGRHYDTIISDDLLDDGTDPW